MSRLDNFERWKGSAPEQAVFMQRVADGETPKAICEAQELPYSALMRHVKAAPALTAEYRSALETWVESLAHETVKIADDVEDAQEASEVAAAKLRVDTRFRIAAKLYREMFGEDVKPAFSVTLNVGDISKEIAALEGRLGIGRVIEMLPPEPAKLPETVVSHDHSAPPI